MSSRVLLLQALLIATPAALAAAPAPLSASVRPQLILHTDAHVARIRQISADAAGRFLLTASEDKTARIWDLATGELRRTWVPPVGADDEGKLFAAALSPDGRTAAVGGWTSDGAKGFSVHFFDRTSGALVRRVGGLRDVVHQLAWSPDGRLVAVATAGGGVRLLRAADGRTIGEDRDYGDTANGIDFSSRGALATVADDGELRVYEASESTLSLRAKKRLASGKRPTAVRFSPDGTELAVLSEDTGTLEVLSNPELKSLQVAADGRNAGLSRLAWTRDGRLLAAGHVAEQRRMLLRVWEQRGRGAVRSFELPATNSVFDLIALADGRAVVATADPLWAVVDRTGSATLVSKSAAIDFRALLTSGVYAAANGERVYIPQPAGGYVSFGFDDRRLSLQPATGARLAAGLGDAVVKREREGDYVQAGSVRYALERFEQPRVLITSPAAALLGSEWFLRLYDARGTLQWKTPLPATAWAVTAVDGGRAFIAALGDGTLRWYSRQNGQELVAFFLKSDHERWVAWTPAGYYDTSPGGENLLGWALASGERADFYPISRFRADYFQPERVGPHPPVAAAATAAPVEGPKKTPPVVEVLSPDDGSSTGESITITLRVRQGSAAPDKFIARVNGRLAKSMPWSEFARQRIAGEDERYRLDLALSAGANDVQLFAASRDGVSNPASIKLSAKPPAKPAAPQPPASTAPEPPEGEFSVKPKLYVVAVGVSAYKDASLTLGFSAKDANDFARTVGKQKGRLYREVEVRLLDDGKATHDAVLDGLEWLRGQVTARDVGMLFIAGHGVNDADGGYYYLPFDTDLSALKRTGVIFSEIRNTMANLAGKALFFIDTCHSGNVLGGRRGVPADVTGIINDLASAENGVVVFSSSTGRQYSLESSAWGNGAFTKALIEGLEGKADFNKRGSITHKMLDFFLAERVKELTDGKQTPVTQAPGGVPDFPIAVY